MIEYPVLASALPPQRSEAGGYTMRFAHSLDDLLAVQRLRYRVFREEEGLGNTTWDHMGLDDEPLDATSHHLIIEHDGVVIGTYRMRAHEHALRFGGFYSVGDFDLATLPPNVLAEGVELSRACVASRHRNGRVLLMLWKGLARYVEASDLKHVFGCCSIPTMSMVAGWALNDQFSRDGQRHPERHVDVVESRRCHRRDGDCDPPALPPLFESYLRLGARVCSEPALDRDFRAISFFVTLDVDELRPAARRTLFRNVRGR